MSPGVKAYVPRALHSWISIASDWSSKLSLTYIEVVELVRVLRGLCL